MKHLITLPIEYVYEIENPEMGFEVALFEVENSKEVTNYKPKAIVTKAK